MILSARNVTKKFLFPEEVEVLRGIDLEVPAGQSVAIMGASGEGKSTLLQIFGTLERPSSGEISIAGNLLSAGNAPMLRNQHLGFVFQNFNLLEDYSTLDNILMPARIGRKKRGEVVDHARELIARVGLEGRADFPIRLLSGGEKQRVAIARALCNRPSLILADEPSGNLDGHTSDAIHELLLESARGSECSLIVVTHDPALAKLCDETYRLTDGILTCESH